METSFSYERLAISKTVNIIFMCRHIYVMWFDLIGFAKFILYSVDIEVSFFINRENIPNLYNLLPCQALNTPAIIMPPTYENKIIKCHPCYHGGLSHNDYPQALFWLFLPGTINWCNYHLLYMMIYKFDKNAWYSIRYPPCCELIIFCRRALHKNHNWNLEKIMF